MKKLHILLTLCLVNIGVGSVCQTADDIIEKHLNAMGGKEKLKSIKTVVMEGKILANGAEIPVTTTFINNQGMRIDINLMGMKGFVIMRPDSGWTFMPFGGQTSPEAVPSDQLKGMKSNFDLSGQLCDYSLKGHQVEYLGLDDVDGTECHKLKVTDSEGYLSYHFIDPDTYFLVRTIAKRTIGGKEIEAQSDFNNYKQVEGGYYYPHAVNSMNGPMEIVKISVNSDVDPSVLQLRI